MKENRRPRLALPAGGLQLEKLVHMNVFAVAVRAQIDLEAGESFELA